MIRDIETVVWKELRELLRIGGGRRGLILRAFFSVGLLGVLWPWLIGQTFITSALPILFAATTAAMYVAALIPDAFPGERERHTLETLLASRLPDTAVLLGKVLAIMSYAMAAALFMVTAGWITVNLKVRHGLLLYPLEVLVTTIVAVALTAGLVAAFGTLVSLRAATVKQAQQVLTTTIMVFLLAPAILAEVWPAAWQYVVTALSNGQSSDLRRFIAVAAGMLIVQVAVFLVARRRFVRARLLTEER